MNKTGFETRLKAGYVKIAGMAAWSANHLGICAVLHARKEKRWAHWLQSLGAIHNIDQMIHLDVPWWTYNAIDEVEQFLADRENARVLEYGSGASTVWLSKRVSSVISIEHHKHWYSIITEKTRNMANVTVVLKEAPPLQKGMKALSQKSGFSEVDFTDYVNAVNENPGPYDMIVIDGRARVACLQVAIQHLAKNGMIVFDNSKRYRYKKAIHSCGGRTHKYYGLTPSLPYFDETTLITFPAGKD